MNVLYMASFASVSNDLLDEHIIHFIKILYKLELNKNDRKKNQFKKMIEDEKIRSQIFPLISKIRQRELMEDFLTKGITNEKSKIYMNNDEELSEAVRTITGSETIEPVFITLIRLGYVNIVKKMLMYFEK